jgi:hypothetical protein
MRNTSYKYMGLVSAANVLLVMPTNTNEDCGPNPSKNELDTCNSNRRAIKKVNVCSNPKCKICPLIDTSGTIECYLTGEKFLC